MLKRAVIYARERTIIIHAFSKTTTEEWVLSEPCIYLDASCSSTELGQAVAIALSRSRTGVPEPTDRQDLLKPLLWAACVESWQAFVDGCAVSVVVEKVFDDFVLLPAVLVGEEFKPDKSSKRALGSTAQTETIGHEVRELLAVA